jgi:hypothetical protein
MTHEFGLMVNLAIAGWGVWLAGDAFDPDTGIGGPLLKFIGGLIVVAAALLPWALAFLGIRI